MRNKKIREIIFHKKNLPIDETIYTVRYHSISLLAFEHIIYCTVFRFLEHCGVLYGLSSWNGSNYPHVALLCWCCKVQKYLGLLEFLELSVPKSNQAFEKPKNMVYIEFFSQKKISSTCQYSLCGNVYKLFIFTQIRILILKTFRNQIIGVFHIHILQDNSETRF